MDTLFVIYVFFSFVLIALAIPLTVKRIGPNIFYGFRVPATLKDKDIWYPVNQLLGKWLLASAIIFLVAAIGLYFIPGITLDQYSLGSLAGFAIPFGIGMVYMVRLLRKLTNRRT
ncbi:MAG: SdpI family protein [Anaerolineales bacterium]